jgi:SnoaL-like protein
MTDVNSIASRYIDLWNERSPARRRAILSENWANDARYVDPLMSGDGHDGVDALVAGVQQRFPEFRFKLLGTPNGFGDHVRFSWGLGPDGADSPIKGTDFAVVSNGLIKSITGFLDQVPQQS